MRLPILQVLNRWNFFNWFKHLSYFSVLLCWGVQRFSDPSLLNETATGDAVSARPCLLWCSAIRASSCFLLCRSSSLNISCLRISDHTCYFKTYSQVTVNTGFVSALKKNRLILLLIPTKVSILFTLRHPWRSKRYFSNKLEKIRQPLILNEYSQDTWKTRVPSLGQEDPMEEEIATHSSIHVWESPWPEEPGPQSIGLQESDMTERLNTHILTSSTIERKLLCFP